MKVTYSIPYGDEILRIAVRRGPMRTLHRIGIHVEPDGRVLVDAPEHATDAQILTAVAKKARWISGHLRAIHKRLSQLLPREYVSGESLLYLGRRYMLKVLFDKASRGTARMRGRTIEVTVPRRDPAAVRAALDAWYLVRAKEVLSSRLDAVAAPLRWVRQCPPVRFQAMRVQWGSCSPAGRLTLNPHLVKAPRECIDYVLLHELCHLRHHNHGVGFYRTLALHMPHWRELKSMLDEMADRILTG